MKLELISNEGKMVKSWTSVKPLGARADAGGANIFVEDGIYYFMGRPLRGSTDGETVRLDPGNSVVLMTKDGRHRHI